MAGKNSAPQSICALRSLMECPNTRGSDISMLIINSRMDNESVTCPGYFPRNLSTPRRLRRSQRKHQRSSAATVLPLCYHCVLCGYVFVGRLIRANFEAHAERKLKFATRDCCATAYLAGPANQTRIAVISSRARTRLGFDHSISRDCHRGRFSS